MLPYLVTSLILLVYLILAWFLGPWLHLYGWDVWILRGALALIGLLAAGATIWYFHNTRAARAAAEDESAPAGAADDLDLLVQEANRRLRSSTLGRGATLGRLPLVFLLGETGSTKSTTVIHSGLDPELLAGQVYQDNKVLPTRTANIWYTRQAVLLDPAGSLMTQPARWRRLVKLVQPGRISTAMGKGRQAPRAALVCYNCENLQPGSEAAVSAAARKLAVRLQEISQVLGISFPVYVLFTKLDQISQFTDFVGKLSKDEASEVLGATLPVRSLTAGVYAEEETRRLGKAFDELFFSLAEKRLDLLTREHDAEKAGGIYEFPREMRKLRPLLSQFLVDLTRPSQLSVNPFLRGFYFTGVRPLILEDAAAMATATVEEPTLAGATRIFSGGGATPLAQERAASGGVGSRRVPQWVFLTQFFNQVMVKDRVALAASGFSSRVNQLRRVGLSCLGLLSLICLIGFLVSFLGNLRLIANVESATVDLRNLQMSPNQVASSADLQRLDRLRQELATLSSYQKDGVPLRLRWGMYVGDQVYPDAKRVYFERFWQLLLAQTQAGLLKGLRAVPDKVGPNSVYENTYNELKAYLITTSNNDKSTSAFLSPVLLSHWAENREIDPHRVALARSQFDFYSSELRLKNPFSANNDALAIARARNYLSQFAGIDRYYLPLLAQASQKNPDISFNDQFNATDVIVSNHKVPGAFTLGGFTFMRDAMSNPALYMRGEDWVLGKATASELDQATVQQNLTQRYYADFTNQWRTVLQTSSVARYSNWADAARKLEKLTDPTSPLLELFWFVSHNTDVGVADFAAVFAPVHAVEPAGPPDRLPDMYILPSNKDYVVALTQLQTAIAPLVINPADANAGAQISNSAGAARVSITKVMGPRVDQQFHTESLVRTLLEQPITNAEGLLGRLPIDQLGGAGRDFCSQFGQMAGKYPFNPNSSQDLPIDQLNAVLAPKTGALWVFYDKSLAQYLTKVGSHYVSSGSGNVKLNPSFVAFFNQAAALSDALYPFGAANPHFSYTLKEMPGNVGEGLALKIGDDMLTGTGQQKTFAWTGTPEDVQVTTKGGTTLGSSYSGPWAVFRLIADAHAQVSGSVTNLEWSLESNGKPNMLNGKPETYNYQLQVAGLNPFRSSELSGLRCVSSVAH
jgi:type VI secretion system protein ImpL